MLPLILLPASPSVDGCNGQAAWRSESEPMVFVWVFVFKPNTQTNRLLPARSRSLALYLARGRGSPPLRFAPTRGPPSSTQHITDVQGKARCRAGAGASGQQQTEDREQRGDRAAQKEEDNRRGSGVSCWAGPCGAKGHTACRLSGRRYRRRLCRPSPVVASRMPVSPRVDGIAIACDDVKAAAG